MLHGGGNLPPLMKRDQLCHRPTRVPKDLAHLQSVKFTRLQTNAHLPRTMAHKVESRFRNVAACRFDLLSANVAMTLCTSLGSAPAAMSADERAVDFHRMSATRFDPHDHAFVHICSSGEQQNLRNCNRTRGATVSAHVDPQFDVGTSLDETPQRRFVPVVAAKCDTNCLPHCVLPNQRRRH
jgi:hypothetical protein